MASWTGARCGHKQALLLLAGLLCSLLLSASAQPTDAAMASPAAPVGTAPAAAPAAAAAAAAAPAAAAAAPAAVKADSQNMTTFFPAVNGDLTKITWAHAVNSKALLKSALDGTVMMLEADVLMGKTPESTAEEPVMGHPPETTSDLSLLEFLRTVTAYNNDNKTAQRGIKLDFKSIDVFEKALTFLKSNFGDVPAFPVWLNADVLVGPVNASESGTVAVDAKRFLAAAKKEYPALMLSLGWTTRWGKAVADQAAVPADEVAYTEDNVKEMLAALTAAAVDQPITYAVRAAFVAHSLPELKSLLDQTKQASGAATLTVWSSDATDVVDATLLKKNILALGKNRVYVDVGEDLAKKLDLANSASASTYASVATVAMALLAVMFRAL